MISLLNVQAATQLENEIERKRREQYVDPFSRFYVFLTKRLARDQERREREEQNKLYEKSKREDKMKDIQKQEDQQMALITSYVIVV
jgi:hypothetical protein